MRADVVLPPISYPLELRYKGTTLALAKLNQLLVDAFEKRFRGTLFSWFSNADDGGIDLNLGMSKPELKKGVAPICRHEITDDGVKSHQGFE